MSIARANLHKRLAWVDMGTFGRSKAIRVGLELSQRDRDRIQVYGEGL